MFDGDSYIYREGTTPQTRTALTSKNKIFSFAFGQNEFSQIGVIGTFDPSHGRGVDPVRGVGFGDQIAELVPTVTDPVTISVTRTLLYLANVFQVFGYAAGVDGLVRDLKHHKWPFDIKQEIAFSQVADESPGSGLPGARISSNGVNKAVLTFYEACWITSYSASFPSDSTIIAETVDISVSDVVDGASIYNEFSETGNNPFLGQLGSARFNEGGSFGT